MTETVSIVRKLTPASIANVDTFLTDFCLLKAGEQIDAVWRMNADTYAAVMSAACHRGFPMRLSYSFVGRSIIIEKELPEFVVVLQGSVRDIWNGHEMPDGMYAIYECALCGHVYSPYAESDDPLSALPPCPMAKAL